MGELFPTRYHAASMNALISCTTAGQMLIPGIQISVYAIPVWVVFMWVCYGIKNKRSAQTALIPADSSAK